MTLVTAVFGIVAVAAGAFAIDRGRRRRRQRRTIEATETTDVLRLTPGPVEVIGTAEPGPDGPIRAPFSEEDCLAASWEIEEWEESGKHSSWRTEGSGHVSTPFYVNDGTDRVLVRPEGAALDIDTEAEDVLEISAGEEPPRAIREFLDLEHTPGDPDRALLAALDWGQQVGDRRYRQDLLRPGERAYVHGTATRVGAGNSAVTTSRSPRPPTTATRTPRRSSSPTGRRRSSSPRAGTPRCTSGAERSSSWSASVSWSAPPSR